MIPNQNHFFKLVIIGDQGVGKSSLFQRVCDDEFSQSYYATIGVDFKFKTFVIDGKQVKIQFWDTAGQERFRNITSAYYRNAEGIIIVYDVLDEVSFNNIKYWENEVKNNASSNVQVMLLGNKNDLEQKKISTETAQSYAQENQMEFFEVSAKTSESVMQAFLSFTRKIMNKIESQDLIRKSEQIQNKKQEVSKNQTLAQIDLTKKEKDGCC